MSTNKYKLYQSCVTLCILVNLLYHSNPMEYAVFTIQQRSTVHHGTSSVLAIVRLILCFILFVFCIYNLFFEFVCLLI